MTLTNHAAGDAVRAESINPIAGGRNGDEDAMAHLCVHALVASTQAAAACSELAEIFEARGEHSAASLFRLLAVSEAERAAEAIRRAGLRPLPQGPAWQHYSWLYRDSPNRIARKLVARLITPPLALRIALEAGGRVKTQYERLSVSAEHPEVRSHANELATEKASQLEMISKALAATSGPSSDEDAEEVLFAMP